MDYLYAYAHRTLQRPLRRERGFFDGLIADPNKRKPWLETAAREVGELGGLAPGRATALSDMSLVHERGILGRPALIVEMPEPQAPTQCYFIATFRGADGELRYYTLERSMAEEPMLCCWSADGRHALLETGPKPEVSAFRAAVEKLERTEELRAEEAATWQPTTGWSTGLLPMSNFPHEALPHWIKSDPAIFERLLADQRERERWVDFGMEVTASLTGMPSKVAHAMQERIRVHGATIAGRPALIVEMPAQHVAECYFLAVFRRPDGEIRYYALERGMAPGQTMLCYRGGDRSHRFIGDGPQPEFAAFRDAVEQAEQQASGGDPASRPFPEGCPIHM